MVWRETNKDYHAFTIFLIIIILFVLMILMVIISIIFNVISTTFSDVVIIPYFISSQNTDPDLTYKVEVSYMEIYNEEV